MKDVKSHRELMAQAYAKWDKHPTWTPRTFFESLDAIERKAVALGNLNYQVNNGGFEQWINNGYKNMHERFLRALYQSVDKKRYEQLHKALYYTVCAMDMEEEPDPRDYGYDRSMEEDYRLWSDAMDDLDVRFYNLADLEQEMEEYLEEEQEKIS